MPSRKAYKTEEDYQMALQRRREYNAYQKDLSKKDEMKVISECKVIARGPVPEGADRNKSWREYEKASEDAQDEGQALRRHLLRRWASTQKGDAIIVIGTHIYPNKGYTSYAVELTAYGGKLMKDWLQKEITDYGYQIGK